MSLLIRDTLLYSLLMLFMPHTVIIITQLLTEAVFTRYIELYIMDLLVVALAFYVIYPDYIGRENSG